MEKESRRGIESVIDYCVNKFGMEKMEDARSAWVKNSEEISKMGQSQVSGDTSRRKF